MRLRDLDPDAVARRAHSELSELARVVRCALGQYGDAQQTVTVGESSAYVDVFELVEHAQHGTGLSTGWGHQVERIAAWLGEDSGLDEPTTPLQIALAASQARLTLAEGRPITTGALAVLASISRQRLQQLQAAGKAPAGRKCRRARMVSAKEAIAWLSERGTT